MNDKKKSIYNQNTSSLFLCPLLGFKIYRGLINDKNLGYVNSYLKVEGLEQIDYGLYIVLAKTNHMSQVHAIQAFQSVNGFEKLYEDENYYVLLFNLDLYKHIYEIYLTGKYSDMPFTYKKSFKKGGILNTYKILIRHNSLKDYLEEKLDVKLGNDAELHDKPNMKKETFNEFSRDTKTQQL